MATQYDPIAKDESLNTTELTPRNIADVLAEGLDDIVSALGGGSLEDLNDVAIVTPSNGQTLKYNSTTQKWENANDAGGHTIYDADESAMTQRAGLGFTDAHVSDNSGDDRTDVSLVQGITDANWALLDPTDESNNGFYQIGNSPLLHLGYVGNGEKKDFDAGAQSDYVEVVADGVKTWRELLNALYALLDTSRVSKTAVLVYIVSGTERVAVLDYSESSAFEFASASVVSGARIEVFGVKSANSYHGTGVGTTVNDDSTSVVASGRKIRLYYNDAHTFDFNTKAENCIYGNSNVKDALDAVCDYSGKELMYYGCAITTSLFVVYLPPHILSLGAPSSLSVSEIVELGVNFRNYNNNFVFNENGLLVETNNALTVGHAMRMTATITWS